MCVCSCLRRVGEYWGAIGFGWGSQQTDLFKGFVGQRFLYKMWYVSSNSLNKFIHVKQKESQVVRFVQ